MEFIFHRPDLASIAGDVKRILLNGACPNIGDKDMDTTQFLPNNLDLLIQSAIAGSIVAQDRLAYYFSNGFSDDPAIDLNATFALQKGHD